MASKDKRVRHLPERVIRQYGFVQTVPRPPTDIGSLTPGGVAMAFMEFALHVLSQQERGDLVLDDGSWSHSRGDMRLSCRVSHPIVNPPAAIPDYTTDTHPRLVPPYEEVIVDQQSARHPPDPLQIMHDVRGIMDRAMTKIPDVYANLVVAGNIERIRQHYRAVGVHGSRVFSFYRIWM